MRTIWKLPLAHEAEQTLSVPQGARIISVHAQAENACLWVEVETNNPPEARTFCIFGTGHPMDLYGNLIFLGTVLMLGGSLVLHVYEKKGEDNARMAGVA